MSSTTIIDAEFRLKLASLRKELESVPGMTKDSAKKSVAEWTSQWKQAEKNSTTTLQKLKADGGAIGKVAEMIGGQWGTALRTLKGSAELATDGLSATTLAAGATVVGVAAVVAGVAALASTVISTTSNIDSLSASLTASQRDALGPQIVAVMLAHDEQEKLSQSWTEAKIVLTSDYAPALRDIYTIINAAIDPTANLTQEQKKNADVVQDLADRVRAGTLTYADLAKQVDDVRERQVRARVASMDTADTWTKLTSGVHEYAVELRALDTDEQARIDKAAKNPHGGLSMTGDAMAEALGMPVGNAVTNAPKSGKAGKSAAEKQADWDKEFADKVASAKAAADGIQSVFAELDAAINPQLEAIGQAGIDAVMGEADAAQNASMIKLQAKRDEVAGIKAANTQIADDNARLAAKHMSDTQLGLGIVAQANASLVGLSDILTQHRIDNTEEGTEAHKKALKKQVAASKAAAIVTATIDMALSIANVWASWASQPIVGGVLTGLAVAAGGVAIGEIAAQHAPQFHRGGVVGNRQPDEMGVNALEGEGFVNRQGMSRIGAQGLHAINRGEDAFGGSPMVISVVDHKVFDSTSARALNRRDSAIARAVRRSRSTRAGHRSRTY